MDKDYAIMVKCVFKAKNGKEYAGSMRPARANLFQNSFCCNILPRAYCAAGEAPQTQRQPANSRTPNHCGWPTLPFRNSSAGGARMSG